MGVGGAELATQRGCCPQQVWQCGGSMEVLPCSRVAHIERTKKPYNNDIDYYAKRNALRAAEVWMDGFKSHVYMAWNIPMTVSRPGRGEGWGPPQVWLQVLTKAQPILTRPPERLSEDGENVITLANESPF